MIACRILTTTFHTDEDVANALTRLGGGPTLVGIGVSSMKKRLFTVVVLFLTGSALAQFDAGSVLGTVRDKTGAAISGAKVTLENLDTGISVARTTDAEGNYEFPGVRIGRYRVSAEQKGFSKAF